MTGASLRRRLFFRCTLRWDKPLGETGTLV
jgi:hypothetical protein